VKFRKHEALHYAIFSSLLLPPVVQTTSSHPIHGQPQITASLPLRDQDSHPSKPTAKIKGKEF
jgi:hypothetical protein